MWLMCQRHLQTNLEGALIVDSLQEKKEILDLFFNDETGLSVSNSMEEFMERKSRIDPSKVKDFERYCERILEGIVKTRIAHPWIRANW